MMSKKDQRIEAKKRKAAAFLQLVGDGKTCDEDTSVSSEKKVKVQAESSNNDGIRFRQALRERQKASMERPKVFLTLDDLDGSNGLPPLFILDLQHLILFALEGNITSFKPRWCKLLRCTKVTGVVVVVLDGVGETEIKKYKSSFPHLHGLFEMSISLTTPSQYGSTVDQELFDVPLSVTELIKMKVPVREAKEIGQVFKPEFSHELAKAQMDIESIPEGDTFPRTHLLLNSGQMSTFRYPLPLEGREEFKDFVFTAEKYEEVTEKSPMFAVDCEMCITGLKRSELTWVSVVNEDLEVIYETLVKPYNRIENYLTRFSGITKEMMKTVSTRLEEVQAHIQKILPPDAILCGQSLNSDLTALKMFHPYVIDTSVIYNLTGQMNVKPSLRRLANLFLGKLIQDDQSGHNPCEDAIATMELVKLKLKQGLHFGDVRLGGIIYPDFSDIGIDETQLTIQRNNSSDTIPMCDSSRKSESVSLKVYSGEENVEKTNPSDVEGSEKIQNRTHSVLNIQQKIEKRKQFFQCKGYSVGTSLFQKLKMVNKKATVVDLPEVVSRYKELGDALTCVETTSDKQTTAEGKCAVAGADFVWTQLHNYQQCITSGTNCGEKKKCLQKLDKRMSKILRAAPQNSLCVVILSGRADEDGINNTMGFVRIKI